MARYVGDLTDPKNNEQRLKAASVVDGIAESIRNREVRHLDVNYDREILNRYPDGVERLSAWVIEIDVTPRGRHER